MFMRQINVKPRWEYDHLMTANDKPIEEFMLMILLNMQATNRALIRAADNEESPKWIIFQRRPLLSRLKVKR